VNSVLPHLLPLVSRKKVYRAISDGLKGLHHEEASKGRSYLPNFIIIGAAKSATTTLATILPRHPDIFFCRHKEPKFFGRCYDKGWDWYRKIFLPGEGCALRGEASTMYASPLGSFRYTPELMHLYLPDVKLVYIVRHPLERLVSHWRHLKGRHPEYVSFDRILSKRSAAKRLIGCSSYFTRLQEFRQFFPDQQIHCLTFEDLLADPAAVLASLLNFLGATAQPQWLLEDGALPRVNEAGQKGRAYVPAPLWPPEMRSRMVDLLRPDAESFLSYIGKPLSYWTW
jgi:hypothetical protein